MLKTLLGEVSAMSDSSVFTGRCHCGNLEARFESRQEPEALFVRRCGCSFCRRHGARYVSDPEGGLRIRVRDPAGLTRYRFGHETADFLVCRECGVFLAAVMTTEGTARAVVNVNTFEDPGALSADPASFDYDAEDEAERLARRAARWTPVVAFVEGSD
jgi:hypothetical protein